MTKLIDKEQFISDNLELLYMIINSYEKLTGIPSEELLSYGYEGLMLAFQNLNGNKSKETINAYLYRCIEGGILNGLPELKGYTSNGIYYRLVKVKKILDEQEEITLEDIIDKVEELYPLKGKFLVDQRMELLIANATYLNENPIIELSKSGDPAYLIACYHDIQEKLKEAIGKLKIREQMILIEHYGLNGEKPLSVEKIGKKYHITAPGVVYIEKNGLKKLKNILKDDGLEMLHFFSQYSVNTSGENEFKPVQKNKRRN